MTQRARAPPPGVHTPARPSLNGRSLLPGVDLLDRRLRRVLVVPDRVAEDHGAQDLRAVLGADLPEDLARLTPRLLVAAVQRHPDGALGPGAELDQHLGDPLALL